MLKGPSAQRIRKIARTFHAGSIRPFLFCPRRNLAFIAHILVAARLPAVFEIEVGLRGVALFGDGIPIQASRVAETDCCLNYPSGNSKRDSVKHL